MSIRVLFIAALLLQTPTAFAAGLTLDDAVRAALQNNKELQAARQSIDIAEARLVQAGLWPNPRLEFGHATDAPFRDEGEVASSIALTQDFPVTGRLSKRKALARVDVALALAEVDEAERRLASEVAGAFYGLVVIDAQIAARGVLIASGQQLVQTTRARLAAAEVSEIDANTAALDLQRLTQERAQLEARREVLAATLNQAMGAAAAAPLRPDGTVPLPAVLPPLDELQAVAVARRGDLRAALLGIDRAEAEQALASAASWEDWTVSLGAQSDHLVIEGAPPQGTDKSLVLGLSIPFPVFNRNQGGIAAAEVGAAQAAAAAAALKLRIANEVVSAYRELRRLEGVLTGYTADMLPLSERNVTLAQRAYRDGQAAIVEVVQVQRQQSDLHAAYLELLDRYLQARVRLATATDAYRAYATHAEPNPPTAGH